MLSRQSPRLVRRVAPSPTTILLPRRTLIPAPSPNSGPLLARRPDRALPNVDPHETRTKWMRTLPFFGVVVGLATLAIFNYQKSSSSVVSSTLYALRKSPQAREILGSEIYFASKFPWISGTMDQLHGVIDISFWVKGTRGRAKMRFRSVRPDRLSYVSLPFFYHSSWERILTKGLV